AVFLEDALEQEADPRVLPIREMLWALDDRDAGAEAGEELGELDRDDASAEEDGALGNRRELCRLAVRPVPGRVEAWDRRNDGFRAGGDDDRVRLEQAPVHLDAAGADDARSVLQHGDAAVFVPGDPAAVVVVRDHEVAVLGE